MNIITGYKLNGRSVDLLENTLNKFRSEIDRCAKQKVTELLKNQCQDLFDGVALRIYDRPAEGIFDCAKNVLAQRISIASAKQYNTPYNMSVGAHVYFDENDTYIMLLCNNNLYTKALNKLCKNGLSAFHARSEEGNKAWADIFDRYRDRPYMMVRLSPDDPLKEIQPKDLVFDKASDRIELRARYEVINRLLSRLSNGQQIAPHMLMPYMTEALSLLEKQEIKKELNEVKEQLRPLIQQITTEQLCLKAKEEQNVPS